MESSYDLVVLGAGPAGRAAAIIARRAGISVIVIEQDGFGGTCPLRGCIPKKILVAGAETFENIRRASAQMLEIGPPKLDWAGLIRLKREAIKDIPETVKNGFLQLGIDVVQAWGVFTGPHTVEAGGREYQGKKFVIATGSKPRMLPIEGFELTTTSDELLEMDDQPASIVFIGAGPIGMEFSHILSRAGTRVTILEAAPRILPGLDKDMTERLARETRKLGVNIFTGVRIEAIEKAGASFRVVFAHEGQSETLETDVVANGAGRVADIDGLDLEKALIERDNRGIVTDAFLRTTNKDVFVAGDAVYTSPKLSPVATYEGKIVAHNITSSDMITPDYSSVPYVVYTIPELAGVGMTGEYTDVVKHKVSILDLSTLKTSRAYAETATFSKVFIEEGTGKILGAHILGHRGQELINIFALAKQFNITSKDLNDFMFAFPTFTSDIKDMLKG